MWLMEQVTGASRSAEEKAFRHPCWWLSSSQEWLHAVLCRAVLLLSSRHARADLQEGCQIRACILCICVSLSVPGVLYDRHRHNDVKLKIPALFALRI
jgi:hypothetical protein